MCGIAAAAMFPSEKKISYRHKKIKQIFNEMLAETEDRGRHATGITMAGYKEDGKPVFAVLKGPYKAEEFIYTEGEENESGMTYPKMMKLWDKMGDNLKTVIGHCRFKTQGDEHDNLNNHPIVVPLENSEIVGVHNGSLDNDNLIFEGLKIKRYGEVDSEAIFRLMHHLKLGKKRVVLDDLVETAKYLDGKYAVVGYNTRNPDLIFTFRDTRPLEFAVCEDLDTIFIASETKFIKAAFERFNRSALAHGWATVKHETFTHHDNHSYVLDTSKELKQETGHSISKYACVDDKTLTRDIYEGFKSKANTTVSNYGRCGYQGGYQGGYQEPNRGAVSSTPSHSEANDGNSSLKSDGPEKEIEICSQIKDRSDEDKEILADTKVITGEIIEMGEEENKAENNGALKKLKDLFNNVVTNVRKKLESSVIEEQLVDYETDVTTTFGCFNDAITSLVAESKFNSDLISLMEEVSSAIFIEGITVGGEAVLDILIEELNEVGNELVKAVENLKDKDIDGIQKDLDKTKLKKRKAEDRIRILTEMLSAVIAYRSWNKSNSGRLADFIENNLPKNVNRKFAYQLISSIGEPNRAKIHGAIKSMLQAQDNTKEDGDV